MKLQPVFKVVKSFRGIILSPLLRYLWHRCCGDPAHVTNSEQPEFASEMGRGLKEQTVNLRNMIFMRKLRGLSVMNTVEALGIVPDADGHVLEIERVLALWGGDPVHPSQVAYRLLAGKIVEKVEDALSSQPDNEQQGSAASSQRKQDPREACVSGSQPVAKRVKPSGAGPPAEFLVPAGSAAFGVGSTRGVG